MAPAWKSNFGQTEARAHELFLAGQIMWGLDETVFELYGIPYQPVTVLIGADKTIVDAWPGLRGEEEIRASIENLLAVSG